MTCLLFFSCKTHSKSFTRATAKNNSSLFLQSSNSVKLFASPGAWTLEETSSPDVESSNFHSQRIRSCIRWSLTGGGRLLEVPVQGFDWAHFWCFGKVVAYERFIQNSVGFGWEQAPLWGKTTTATATKASGGYFRNFWVRMCRWDPGSLNLYQS